MRCDELIKAHNLGDVVSVTHASIYDYKPDEKFDIGYFSGSLMIMPFPSAALTHVETLLTPRLEGGARIFTTQTFEQKKSALLEAVKPLLKFITTIDFGNVTYESDFGKTVADAGLEVESTMSLTAKGLSRNTGRTFKLFMLKKSSK